MRRLAVTLHRRQSGRLVRAGRRQAQVVLRRARRSTQKPSPAAPIGGRVTRTRRGASLVKTSPSRSIFGRRRSGSTSKDDLCADLGGNDHSQGGCGQRQQWPVAIDGGAGNDILNGGAGGGLPIGGSGSGHLTSGTGNDIDQLAAGEQTAASDRDYRAPPTRWSDHAGCTCEAARARRPASVLLQSDGQRRVTMTSFNAADETASGSWVGNAAPA